MKKIIILTLIIGFGFSSSAQIPFKQNHDFGLALSAGSSEFNAALSWKQTYGLFKNKKFKIGYGLRYNFYTGGEKNYSTAPAELTSKMTGPGVFFSETYAENLDTIVVSNPQHHSINATIYLEYDFNDKWGVGFNIDAFGFAFGPEVTANVISSSAPASASLVEKAKPTPYNVLLISDNDIGMLNSELYASYRLNKQLGFRLGFTFEFTEYTTNRELEYNFKNDRFRHKSLMGMVAISYRPFLEK